MSLLDSADIDGNNWTGNGHTAPAGVHYYLYVTYSLNALDETPTFHTQRISDDPVQIGSMCLNSGDCRTDEGGSNRNLLDFNDLTLTQRDVFTLHLQMVVLMLVHQAVTLNLQIPEQDEVLFTS